MGSTLRLIRAGLALDETEVGQRSYSWTAVALDRGGIVGSVLTEATQD